MNSTFARRLTAILAVIAGSGAALAQAPVFVAADAQPLQAAAAAEGSDKLGHGVTRPSPVLMETRGHVHADGTVSTTCAAIPSAVPHSASDAVRPIAKQQER